ncbi:DUF3558 family protein [Streptomyces sp. NBC_00841]|uniref:DUF3558 family protein n=1 Tax=unclassified Streptomyces TaxID=2593676 RepID=UPI00224CCB29|nr:MULTISPECIES: DUF3558 family protein [unclassified Streptomyces]MCX4534436.1 DUF3558 family protein [Streptomyces sp. NBC_01669]WSA00211.1 DUF3558 family protein [Streptomyces sp. NBC_00841]
MHRSAPRLTRILACAAVPVMLVVAGCSSDSDSKKESGSSSASAPSAQKTEATVEPAKFAELPDPCDAISAKTITSLVPKAKSKAGTPARSSDTGARAGCSWNGLDDNGVKGSQYRWLDVGFTRFESDQALGSGAKRAQEDLANQVAKSKATEGAKKVVEAPVSGIGDQATTVTYDLTKTKEDFKYATVVARTGNVVVTLTYNGAGYAGAKTPSGDDILKGAEKAAKEAVAAVADANGKKSSPSAGTSKSPTATKSAASAKSGSSPKSTQSAGSPKSTKSAASTS